MGKHRLKSIIKLNNLCLYIITIVYTEKYTRYNLICIFHERPNSDCEWLAVANPEDDTCDDAAGFDGERLLLEAENV